ncbi:hypothetical protein T484DRAFT_1841174 [Baffinella frigidus]|nr:hypothetical protein T484DRAFT_1841174 [Cryptophyta sp. CCMP2293]
MTYIGPPPVLFFVVAIATVVFVVLAYQNWEKPQKEERRCTPPTKEHWVECPVDAPFPSLEGEGEWRPSARVKQLKSFGKFCCRRCNKSWRSAHAYDAPEYQQCTSCMEKVEATWRWQTTSRNPRSASSYEKSEGEPHQQALCSVCKRFGRPCWVIRF